MKWIDVKEKLPDHVYDRCLIFVTCQNHIHNLLSYNYLCKCCSVNIGYYLGNNNWEICAECQLLSTQKVTHWMPLPKLPKEIDD